MSVVSAVVIVTVTGLLGAAILVVASQFMKVEVDDRIELMMEVLPAVNCGACGFAGCADYAAGVVNGAATNMCVPGGAAVAEQVSAIMGVDAGDVEKRKAIVACKGSSENVTEKYVYEGVQSCAACNALHGGSSSCSYGCLGFGDCVDACKFDALEIRDGVAHVNLENCTGCGACEDVCPKKIIWIREESKKPIVMCANHQKGALTRKVCSAGCIACKQCEKACEADAIKVINNVARIDLEKCTACGACISVCPVNVITIPELVGC